jgi:hypothetical protein
MNQKKNNKTKYEYIDDEQIQNLKLQRNNNIINDKMNYRNNNAHRTNFIKNSSLNGLYGIYNKQGNHFNNVGNLIMSHNNNNNNFKLNKKNTYDFKRNNIDMNNMNMKRTNNIGYNNYNNDINKNELNNDKEFINLPKEYNTNERYDNLFDKEEYNKLYQKGQGISNQLKKNLNINCNNELDIKEFDKKMKYELSTIKHDKYDLNNYLDLNNDFDLEHETIENNKNNDINIENNNEHFN